MRMIDADALYEKVQHGEELARSRVLDTESTLPYPNNLNPSYTRYVAQMDERIKLKYMIADAPTIEPKHGEWIPIRKGERGYSAGDFRCSVCHQPNKCYIVTNYCSHCGALMRDK